MPADTDGPEAALDSAIAGSGTVTVRAGLRHVLAHRRYVADPMSGNSTPRPTRLAAWCARFG